MHDFAEYAPSAAVMNRDGISLLRPPAVEKASAVDYYVGAIDIASCWRACAFFGPGYIIGQRARIVRSRGYRTSVIAPRKKAIHLQARIKPVNNREKLCVASSSAARRREAISRTREATMAACGQWCIEESCRAPARHHRGGVAGCQIKWRSLRYRRRSPASHRRRALQMHRQAKRHRKISFISCHALARLLVLEKSRQKKCYCFALSIVN